jgi:hypothetical protein
MRLLRLLSFCCGYVAVAAVSVAVGEGAEAVNLDNFIRAESDTYFKKTPLKNDGQTPHVLEVPKDVPVDGFWSISLYNADGFFQKNDLGAYSLNNSTATKNADGSVTVRFGGCDGKVANCLPIVKGWNYTVRLYRPRKQVVDGTWKFPAVQPAK